MSFLATCPKSLSGCSVVAQQVASMTRQTCVNCVVGPCRIDPYGFERPQDYESYKQMMNEYVAVLNRRSVRWSRLLQESPHVEKNLTGDRSPTQHTSALGTNCAFM